MRQGRVGMAVVEHVAVVGGRSGLWLQGAMGEHGAGLVGELGRPPCLESTTHVTLAPG